MQLKVFTSLHRPKRYPCLALPRLASTCLALPPLRHAITAGAAGVVSLDASHTCHVCKSNMLPWLWQSCFSFALLFNLWCGIMQNQPTRRLSCTSLSTSLACLVLIIIIVICSSVRIFCLLVLLVLLHSLQVRQFVSNLDDSPCKVSVKDLNEGY